MDYRTLGRTGVKVSPLCLGAMNFGGATNEEESVKESWRSIVLLVWLHRTAQVLLIVVILSGLYYLFDWLSRPVWLPQ